MEKKSELAEERKKSRQEQREERGKLNQDEE